jgi:hypothetical protein
LSFFAALPWHVHCRQTSVGFRRAARTKHLGVGRPVLPPMPWFKYAKMTESDLKAMFEYLRSLPPISNSVPSPIPPPSKNQAASMRGL